MEFGLISDRMKIASDQWNITTCGWGVMAAAIETARHVARETPGRVVLAGLAGTFEPETCPIGTASQFGAVAIDGIGVGQGSNFQSAADLQWGKQTACDPGIVDLGSGNHRQHGSQLLLTVCAASQNREEANHRRLTYPDAVAEDMEGYSVAMVCRRECVPLQIIRGFCNLVGDRNQANWQIESAIDAVVDMLCSIGCGRQK